MWGEVTRVIAFESSMLPFWNTATVLSPGLSAGHFASHRQVKRERVASGNWLSKATPVLSPPSTLRELIVQVWVSVETTTRGTVPRWRADQRSSRFSDSSATENVKICTSAFKTSNCHFGGFLVSYSKLRNQIAECQRPAPHSLTKPLNQTNWNNKYAWVELPRENATLGRCGIYFRLS